MISLVDFVKAFNSNLEYRIFIVVDEICDVFSGNKEEFIKRVQNPYCFQDYYVQHVDFDVGYDDGYDNSKLVEDEYCLYIDADTTDNLDDFTLDGLTWVEKELNRNNYRTNKYKISNVISENNIVKSFNVEKCEWNLKDLKTVFCMA